MSTPTVVIEGRVVADPELKFSQQGRAFLKFRVAASDSKKDDATQQWETVRSLFTNVTVFEDAEKLAEQILKGSRVTVVGKLHEREFEHNGEKRRSLEVAFPMVRVQTDRQQSGGNFGGQPQSQGYAPPQGGYAPPPGQANDPWGNSNAESPF